MDHQLGTYGNTLDTEVTEKTQKSEKLFKSAYKFLIEEDKDGDVMDDLNMFFRKQIFKNDVQDYINENGMMYLSPELLMTIAKSQIVTVEQILEHMRNDDFDNERPVDDDDKSQINNPFGMRIPQINKPYVLKKSVD